MSLPTMNIIGCGKLGKTLAKLFATQSLANIVGIVNATFDSAEEAVKLIGSGKAYQTLASLPPADIYFITTRDDLIESTCVELAAAHRFKKNAMVLHCSGLLSSEVLHAALAQGCQIASVHPLKSFASHDSVSSLKNVYCIAEGDPGAMNVLTHLFEALGGSVFCIQKNQKLLYHAAAVMANNYLVTLHYHATHCFQSAGIDNTLATQMTSLLMRDALQHIQETTHEMALTGPLQRGDTEVIKKHLTALSEHPNLQSLYTLLGQNTLPITQHDEEVKKRLRLVLGERAKEIG